MNMKKILSSALVVIMIFSCLVAVLPMSVSAAYSSEGEMISSTATANLTDKELAEYLNQVIAYNYETAEEMLDAELKAGYLYKASSAGGLYELYINKYTGFVYYRNKTTGQILTSNPINPGYTNAAGAIAVKNEDTRQTLMSQIEITFENKSTSQIEPAYTSFRWSALRSQIKVSSISNGLRVTYTLGDTTTRFLLPGALSTESFENNILLPVFGSYYDYFKQIIEDRKEEFIELLPEIAMVKKQMKEAFGITSADDISAKIAELGDLNLEFFDNPFYSQYNKYGILNTGTQGGLRLYIQIVNSVVQKMFTGKEKKIFDALYSRQKDVQTILAEYSVINPAVLDLSKDEHKDKFDEWVKKYPIVAEMTPIYVYAGDNIPEAKRPLSNLIKKHCPDYTFTMMFADEKECGYVDNTPQKPVFRCALEYTFNEDGSLSVRLPASSITFDETAYTLKGIKALQYFGYADASNESYMFFPDGSGTIVDLADFYNEETGKKVSLNIPATTYGKDYCYSAITGAHKQQVTMPVYGIVTEMNANETTSLKYDKDRVTNGFFAIIEEGSALANLSLTFGGSTHKFGGVSASFTPYPSDVYDLSETISVGKATQYTMVSESKYTGSYVTRYAMLCDEEVGGEEYGEGNFFNSSYVGMASYYRNYLKETGVLEALELVSEDLPLYIEVLGSMEVIKKILTFPVTASIPLTTFENVEQMYKELHESKDKAKELLLLEADAQKKLADEADDANAKERYLERYAFYTELANSVGNIDNINFRLTGFSNGGMKFTYPTQSRWESACGGDAAYKKLLDTAKSESAAEGVNFGVYPDFDFMYINNSKLFDGMSVRGNVSRMIDNRYASKQVYNSIIREYESFFTLVISSHALDNLYTKFEKSFSRIETDKISLSTMGSDVNSNFDRKMPINRDQATKDISTLLDRIANEDGYEIMLDMGNIYTVEYATHILRAQIDSSHMRYSSYTIPFTGLVLHSYVNYSGTPINYAGNMEYELLRSIENGAAPYFILCYQNSASLKEDEELNKYYGVDYENWYNDILKVYAEFNAAIGDLQSYEIVDHRTLIAERIIESGEMEENFETLKNEIVELLDKEIYGALAEAYKSLREDPNMAGVKVKIVVDRAALMQQFSEILNTAVEELEASEFADDIDALIAEYSAAHPGDDANSNSYEVKVSSIEYKSEYSFITDSFATDKNYVSTRYTIDNKNVVMVTYSNGEDSVSFILNYNNYSVNVRLASGEYTVGGCGYVKID